MQVREVEVEKFEGERRDFLNSIFALLKGLSLHDIRNEALSKPWQQFQKSLQELGQYSQAEKGVGIQFKDGLLTVLDSKFSAHYSINESTKFVPSSMEMALIESITFKPSADLEVVSQFFSAWALHCSVHQKPKALAKEFSGVEIVFVDPDQANLRLKSKSLLQSPRYALQRYFLLCQNVSEFFRGVSDGRISSQRKIRRDLLDMVEVAEVNPYQLVALSLLRHEETGLDARTVEAVASALLAIVLGREFSLGLKQQIDLGIIAVNYNIGLLSKELSELVQAERRLNESEYQRVLEGMSGGVFQLLKAQGATKPVLERLLALFEATQGSQGGHQTANIESRILRLIVQYVALTSQRPYRDAYKSSEAMQILGANAASRKDGSLDPIVYYVFVRLMGVYPVGSLVRLQNHQKAVIYRPSGEKFGEPLIKLIDDQDLKRSQLIDISHADLKISEVLDAPLEGISTASYFFD